MTGGTRAKQIELRFLDAVLGFAACAVKRVVEVARCVGQGGHDKPRVVALAAIFKARDDAALLVPTISGVAKFIHLTLFGTTLRIGRVHPGFEWFDEAFQPLVARQSNDVVHAMLLAPP